jgi:hypothetical protein
MNCYRLAVSIYIYVVDQSKFIWDWPHLRLAYDIYMDFFFFSHYLLWEQGKKNIDNEILVYDE